MKLETQLQYLNKYILCYIENNVAHFTSKSLSEQWGDDWNDIPYEHNAGEPYYDNVDDIVKLSYLDWELSTPRSGCSNSIYSIENINYGEVAWLVGYDYENNVSVSLYAGATIKEFIDFMKTTKSEVFVPLKIK